MTALVHTVIDGRNATVAYLDEDWNLTEADKATLAKVIFEDGEMLFLTPAGKETTPYQPLPGS